MVSFFNITRDKDKWETGSDVMAVYKLKNVKRQSKKATQDLNPNKGQVALSLREKPRIE